MVQFMTVVLLYQIGSNLTDWQFLYEDLFIVVPLCFFMGMTKPYPKLGTRLPEDKLLSYPTIISVSGATFIQLAFQLGLFFPTREHPWNQPLVVEDPEEDYNSSYQCDANTVLFLLSNFQLIWLAVTFSRDKPFRLPILTNYWFVGTALILAVLAFYFLLSQHYWVRYVFYHFIIPQEFLYKILMVMFGCLVATFIFEAYIVRFLEDFEYGRKNRVRARTIARDLEEAITALKELNLQSPGRKRQYLQKDADGKEMDSDDFNLAPSEGREKRNIQQLEVKSPSKSSAAY